ncbi:MAG: AMP-binding protein [Panacagrimonas sp.]
MQRPEDIWLVQPMGGGLDRNYRFLDVVDEARRLASWLGSHHFPPGSAVAVLSQNCAHFLVMDLAIWMAGHVSVPLYPTMQADVARYVLDHCQAQAIFVGKLPPDAPALAAIPHALVGLRCVLSPSLPDRYARWEDVIRDHPPCDPPTLAPGDIATILYTSGTTGRPKGVEHSFGSLAAAVESLKQLFELGPNDRVLSYLPLAHIGERVLVEGMSFTQGLRVQFVESLETFANDLVRTRPTVFGGVPRIWTKLRDGVLAKLPEPWLGRLLAIPVLGRLMRAKIRRQLGLDAARFGLTGGAPLPADLGDFFESLGLPMVELYGMTENGAVSHCGRIGKRRRGRIGPPSPGVAVRFASDGEILVRSPAQMRGYHRDAAATTAAFTDDGWLRTGDRGEADPEGFLRVTGRVKEIFKTSKGKYVAPAGIENALCAGGLLEQACVMGAGEPQPFAAAVLAPVAQGGEGIDIATLTRRIEQLMADVNAGLPPHERLSRLVVLREPWTIDAGLITPTLKIRREPIEQRYAARVAAQPEGVSWI